MDPTANNNASLRLARVLRLYRASNTADVVFMDDGWPQPYVPILADSLSSRAGAIGHADPTQPAGDNPLSHAPDDELIAVCAFMRGAPLVVGFLTPSNCQLLFDRVDFAVDRHPSDVYTTTDKDGNYEFYHPSGTYIRIAETPEHEDLTGQDNNRLWAIERNTDKRVHLHAEVAAAGDVHAVIDIDPEGNVLLDADGNGDMDFGGDVNANVGGALNATAGGSIVFKSPDNTVDGPLRVTDNIVCDKTMTAAVDVIGAGVSLPKHLTTGVQPGNGTSGLPK